MHDNLIIILGASPPSIEDYLGTIIGGVMIGVMVAIVGFLGKSLRRAIYGEIHPVACTKCEAEFFHNTKQKNPTCPACGHSFSLEAGAKKFAALVARENSGNG